MSQENNQEQGTIEAIRGDHPGASPLQAGWEKLCLEFQREDGDVRLLTIALLSGILTIMLLLPLILS